MTHSSPDALGSYLRSSVRHVVSKLKVERNLGVLEEQMIERMVVDIKILDCIFTKPGWGIWVDLILVGCEKGEL